MKINCFKNMLGVVIFLISVSCSIIVSECARILAVFPVPSISHQFAFRPLTQELAKRGDEVIVLTTDPAFRKGDTPINLTEVDLHDMSYKIWTEFLRIPSGEESNLNNQIKTILDLFTIIFAEQIQSEEVQNIVEDKANKFDLLITEACVRPTIAFSHIYKCPLIQISSTGAAFENYQVIGGPTHPLLYPGMFNQKLINLTIPEKVDELFKNYLIKILAEDKEKDYDAIVQRYFGSNVPKVSKLNDNIGMLFLNVHRIWEGNFPVPPNVIHMGGLHQIQIPSKPLPEDLKSFLDSSINGVIYLSFGTNTIPSAIPADKIQMFVKIFSELPYDILWKWDKDELPNKSKNIKIGKWFPQSDMLKHPNIKLFITQGGQQSTDEAIMAGVPLIGIPMLGDQWYNVEKYLIHKIGVRLDLDTLTEGKLRNAINNLIQDESYSKNIKTLYKLMNDEPLPVLDRVMRWVQHILRNGGAKHLRAPAHNLTYMQYFEIELVVTVILIMLFFITTVILIFRLILILCQKNNIQNR